MNKQKGFAVIYALVGILVIIVVAGGGIYWTQKINKEPSTDRVVLHLKQLSDTEKIIDPKSSANPNQDETVNWKTYRNKKFGFELKYPSSWGSEEETPIKPDIVIYSPDNLSNLVIAPISEARYTTNRNRVRKLSNSPTILFAGRSAREYKEEFNDEFKKVLVRDIQIEDLSGLEWTKPNEISYWVDKQQPEQLKVFDQILSTFRFDSLP